MKQFKHLLMISAIAAMPLWAANDPLNAVVRVECTQTVPNFRLPWMNHGQQGGNGSGVVITGNRILTNAHNVADNTLLTIRKQNEDTLYVAKVEFVDHDCDLALLSVDDPNFFADVTPFEIGETPPPQTQVLAAGYPVGGSGISLTQGIVSRIEVVSYSHSYNDLLAAQLDAAINPGNSGGPIFCGNKVVGIAFQGDRRGENLGYMIPCEIIKHFLTDIKDGRVDGFGETGISAIPLDNQDTRAYLKMKPGETGIMVCHLASEAGKNILKEQDVILAIDGHKIANNGNIRLPNGQPRCYTTVFDQKQIGETVTLTLLRNGKKVTVKFPISKRHRKGLPFLYDKTPEYYIVGGFVFTKLSLSYLNEFRREHVPMELMRLIRDDFKTGDEETVVLSCVLADEVNIGYQHYGRSRLEKINGKEVRNLQDVIRYFETTREEYVNMTFNDDPPAILNVKKLKQSTPRILQRYRIASDRNINANTVATKGK